MDLLVTDNACLNSTLQQMAAGGTGDLAACTATVHVDMWPPLWYCDGRPEEGFPKGTWVGHMVPCAIFLVWSCHWMVGSFRQYLHHRPGEPYVSLAHYGLPCLPRRWPVESLAKVVLPPFAILAELLWAQHNVWRFMFCPAGSARAGRVLGKHVGNWAHASMYVGFMISGVVDCVGHWGDLPPGSEKVFLSLAFLLEALLMGLHAKHTPLDVALHTYLTYTMLAASACVLLEYCHPHAFLFSCGRAAAAALQGLWFWAAARILYEGAAAWDTLDDTDAAAAWFAATYFTMHCLSVLLAMLAVFLLMTWAHRRRSQPHGAPLAACGAAERQGLLCVDEPTGTD